MKALLPRVLLPILIAILALPFYAHAQQREIPLAGPFEEPPVLDPAKDLLPEYLNGAHHKITGTIPTYSGHNQYTVESEFGNVTVDGSVNLAQLVSELGVIDKLQKLAATKEYAAFVEKAGQSPVALVKKLAKYPVTTVDGVPGSPWKYVDHAAQAAPEAVKGKASAGEGEDKDLAAFAKVKRDLAAALAVDVYSSNPVLQKELNGAAWVAYGSGTAIPALLAPVGGGAPKPEAGADAPAPVLSPAEERADAQAKLAKMGVAKDGITAFLNNAAYSPTAQAELVVALEALAKVAGRAEYIRLANVATNPTDARFFVRCAQVAAGVGQQVPLVRLISHRGLPLFISEDGVAFLPLEWDYACWTESTGQLITSLKVSAYKKDKITGFHVVLTGVASERFSDELNQRDFSLSDKALPCPIKQEVKSSFVPRVVVGQAS